MRRLGIDFDNTLVCYDELFSRIAREQNLITDAIPARKETVRDELRRLGKEDIWTELQGLVYGDRILEASPFDGVLETLAKLRSKGHELFIVSHKTQFPYLGPKYDLHQAARDWLKHHGFFEGLEFSPDEVFFELTKEDKLARIGKLGCEYFIDDLPEFLLEPTFPEKVKRILFDPADSAKADKRYQKIKFWPEIIEILR